MSDLDSIDRLDSLVNDAAEQYNAKRATLLTATGDRPWGSKKLSPQDKLARFASVWEDDNFWVQAVDRERIVRNLGHGQVYPEKLIEEARDLVQRLREKG